MDGGLVEAVGAGRIRHTWGTSAQILRPRWRNEVKELE